MRMGLALPHYTFSFPDHEPLTWPRLVDAARRAERLGFDSVWISDHFVWDLARYGGPAELQGTVEPFTALAGLAAVTERVRLGTLVAAAPFRHPAIVAKMATTIDLASGGRFDLGLGSGWYEREFEAFGYRFGTAGSRFSILEESVEVIAGLLHEEPFSFAGAHFTLREAFNRPRPLQEGGPPIWVGGKGGRRLLRLAARHAAGWNTVWKWTPETYGERIAELERLAKEEGRDPASIRRSVGLSTLLGEDEADLAERYRAMQRWTPGGAIDDVPLATWATDTLTGTIEACVERLRAFADHGVEEMIVAPASLPFAVFDWDEVELIADRLIPPAARL
jgi:F420-dependent oxidoreductase-like protein